MVKHSQPNELGAFALAVARHLPQDEAFGILRRALVGMAGGMRSNIAQAIAHTKHSDAAATLGHHLEVIWGDRTLFDDSPFINLAAFEATTCIGNLLALGAVPADFGDRVRQLSQHRCARNRDSCLNFLGQYYAWLK